MTTSRPGLPARDLAIDVLIALALTFIAILGTPIISGWTHDARPLDLLGWSLLGVHAVPIVFRRRAPIPALVGTLAIAFLYLAFSYPAWLYILAIVLAIWTAVSAGHRRAAIIATGTFFAAVVVAGLLFSVGHLEDFTNVLWLTGWLVASIVLGEVSRGRREQLQAAEQRAIDAERTREEEARRRAGEERLRIARELHDVLAHNISMINVQAGVAVHLLDKQPEQARTALIAINRASKEAMRELRATLGVLRQVDEVEPRDPSPGLARLGDLVARAAATGLEVDVGVEGEARTLPAGTDLNAYRIVQESLTNVARHAGAARAHISLRYRPNELVIQVDDDGIGVAGGTDPTPGNGLIGMRERAVTSGGDLEAGPRPGGGFRVRARLPLDATS